MLRKMAAAAMALALSVGLTTGALAAPSGAANAGPGVTVQDREIMFDVPRLLMEIHYPQVGGLNNQSAQDRINAYFQAAAIRVENEGYANQAGLPPGSSARGIKAQVWLTYKVTDNRNGLLSVSFTNYQYGGGANGPTTRFSPTLNTKTGEVYTLRSLFEPGYDYVAAVNREITRQMRAGGLESSLVTPFVSIAPNQDFYFTPAGLVVYFQQDEYFPHSFGTVEFPIKFANLPGLVVPSAGRTGNRG